MSYSLHFWLFNELFFTFLISLDWEPLHNEHLLLFQVLFCREITLAKATRIRIEAKNMYILFLLFLFFFAVTLYLKLLQ
jgi:hypothetical protein